MLVRKISVILNGAKKELENNDLKDILKDFGSHIAVSINDEIISKNSWAQTKLKNNDKIDIVEFVPGG